MSASKSFIKNAVGILIVVAICFVAVTIYKKGHASINNSISDYDEIVSQFENAQWQSYEASIVSGSQIVELMKSLKPDDNISIQVVNGYTAKNDTSAQTYKYSDVYEAEVSALSYVVDKANSSKYINPNALFDSSLVYDDNKEISSIVFKQR